MVCCNTSSQNGWSLTHGEPEVHLFCGQPFVVDFISLVFQSSTNTSWGRCFKPWKGRASGAPKHLLPRYLEDYGIGMISDPRVEGDTSQESWIAENFGTFFNLESFQIPFLPLLWNFHTFKAGIKNGGSTTRLVLDNFSRSALVNLLVNPWKTHHWKSNWIISSVTPPP